MQQQTNNQSGSNSSDSSDNNNSSNDSSSKIKLTGDSYVTSLNDDDSSYSNIDFNGYKLYVNGKPSTNNFPYNRKKYSVFQNFLV